MDVRQVNYAIKFGNFTNTELNSIVDALQFARSSLIKKAKRLFTVGSAVKFFSLKRGITVQGTVAKIGHKYITVSTNKGNWRVPANMLEAA